MRAGPLIIGCAAGLLACAAPASASLGPAGGIGLDAADPTHPTMERHVGGAGERWTPASGEAGTASDAVVSAIRTVERRGAISPEDARRYRSIYSNARQALRRLEGARRRELRSVVGVAESLARRGQLFSHRMPAVFETIRRNREWWTQRAFPASGSRHTFPNSEVVWQYYPGRGIQIQPLANFGKANGLWSDGNRGNRRLQLLLDEMLALSSRRGSAVVWEYWFSFGGGRPPWVSGMAQGTAVQALGRAGRRFERSDYHDAAEAALRSFRQRTPRGVRVPAGSGADWWALYSFDPGLRVLNGHVQATNGINDYRAHSGSGEAAELFRRGDIAAHRRIRGFDTGHWSKYAHPGREADLNYHQLNRDVMQGLCRRGGRSSICWSAERFSRYLSRSPRVLSLAAGPGRVGRNTTVRFRLAKLSSVTITIRRSGSVVRRISTFRYRGRHTVRFPSPGRAGTYEVEVSMRDPAGNTGSRTTRLRVRSR